MINSIIFNFKYIFNKKVRNVVIIYCFSIAIFQAIRIKQIFRMYDTKGGFLDYILFTIGGKENPATFAFTINWILITLMIVYIATLTIDSVSKLSIMSLNRINNRFKFWMITCINQLMASIVIYIILLSVLFIVGGIFFGIDFNYTPYTKIFYKNWHTESFITLIINITIVFVSGMYTLQTIVQLSLLGFKNKFNLFIAYLMTSISTGILYTRDKIPRVLAPLFYSSTLLIQKHMILNAILLNLLISIIGIIIGYIVFRKKDFTN